MILVICGAGASYDSLDSRQPSVSAFDRAHLYQRPPLANELFLPDHPIVTEGFKLYHQCHPIVPYLRKISDVSSVEDKLEDLQSEADQDEIRKQQVAAVIYYLRFLITHFDMEWQAVHHGITNYVTMVDQLRRSHGKEPVCIVTFNYDCMIERALSSVGVKIDSLDGYVANPVFKLFKLHGSVNWVKKVQAPFDSVNAGRNEKEVVEELIQNAAKIETSSDFHMCNVCPAGKIGTTPVWPALAIPVKTKRSFVCPEEHLKCLQDLLPETKRIITIGWRGMETHFLDLLKQGLAGKQIGILAVNGGASDAQSVIENLSLAGISTGAAVPYESGFSNAITSRQVEHYCR